MGDKKKSEQGIDDKKNVVTEEFLKTVGNKIRRRELGAQLKRQKKKVCSFSNYHYFESVTCYKTCHLIDMMSLCTLELKKF